MFSDHHAQRLRDEPSWRTPYRRRRSEPVGVRRNHAQVPCRRLSRASVGVDSGGSVAAGGLRSSGPRFQIRPAHLRHKPLVTGHAVAACQDRSRGGYASVTPARTWRRLRVSEGSSSTFLTFTVTMMDESLAPISRDPGARTSVATTLPHSCCQEPSPSMALHTRCDPRSWESS